MIPSSKLRIVSHGIVAANKPLNSNDIEVTPLEKLSMSNGEVTDNLTTQNAQGVDADGASYQTTVKTAATVTAEWLPFGSNRKTAPDVRRGEEVCIWQFGDADKYYWSELKYNPKLRKKETIKFQLSNTDEEDAEDNADNTYFLHLSTHLKLLHLHTSTSDGEPFGYDVAFNTKDGNLQITDTAGNSIYLDSASNRIVLRNADNTSFDLNGENLYINVVKNLSMKVGGDFTTEVKGSYNLKTEGNYLTDSAQVDFVTPQFTTSEKFTTGDLATIGTDLIVSANATIKGNLSLGKGMTTGALGGGGDITLNGSITSSGGANFSQAVIAPNIN